MTPDEARVGARVTYDDEDPATTDFRGTIVNPTAEELAAAADYSAKYDPIGPDAGDVLVLWDDDDGVPSWNDPGSLLRLLPDEAHP